MTRQRKEIVKKMNELDAMKAAELAMGQGFGAEFIEEAFAPEMQALQNKLAATYGLTLEEYFNREYEIGCQLYNSGVLPFC